MVAPFSSTPSRSFHSAISLIAVFSPTPGTPGMLSVGSPIRAWTSTTRPGSTPNLACTSAGPIRLSCMVSSMVTRPETTCIRSLSPDTMTTSAPARSQRVASVAMMSSAS